MSAARVRVCVPATTANLGPGFDCLGLTLDLWNAAEFELGGEGCAVSVRGEGEGILPTGADNLVVCAFLRALARRGLPPPAGLRVCMLNAIPSGSGLGSSASAVILGLLGADRLYGLGLQQAEIIDLAVELEGHCDNAAAALLGGLVVSLRSGPGWLARRFDVPRLQAALVLPALDLPTREARKVLPLTVPRGDAVFNASRALLVAEALRSADLDLLAQVMEDRLHQPYRLPLIPGALEAMAAARQAGAAAVALSGAGPSPIAFCPDDSRPAADAMQAAFARAGLPSRPFHLVTTSLGASIES